MAGVGHSGSPFTLIAVYAYRGTRDAQLTLLLCKRGSVQILRVPLNVPL
jgi:hypothetical protein